MSGRFKPDDPSDENMTQVYYSEENFERLRRAQILASRKNVTLAQIGLAYVLQQAFPVIALAGPTTVSHLENALGALNIELNREEIEFLEVNKQATP